MKCRTFTAEDQAAFAELSGDYNPLHVDPVAARRLLYRAPVVHELNALMWALDAWLEERAEPLEICALAARFFQPIRVGEAVRLALTHQDESHLGIELFVGETVAGDTVVGTVEFEWAKAEPKRAEYLEARFPEKREPRVLSAAELEGRSGTLGLCLNTEATARLFPQLARCCTSLEIAALLATTRLVGMECPGLHSLFSELRLRAAPTHRESTLTYAVTEANQERGTVVMDVAAPGLAGQVKASLRPAPAEQASYAELRARLKADEFVGQRALVVGGSRGLGEVVAKLLAAGGSDVKVTYHLGEQEARHIVDEITSGGGSAGCVACNVLSTEQQPLVESLNGWRPTHVYYFATPFIFSGTNGAFSPPLFHSFCDYYLTGFLNVMNAIPTAEVTKVFHPSSVVVEQPAAGMAEFAVAKSAAEALCAYLESSKQGLFVYRPRLARMATDQTVAMAPADRQDPAPAMVEHLRIFRDTAAAR